MEDSQRDADDLRGASGLGGGKIRELNLSAPSAALDPGAVLVKGVDSSGLK